MLLRRRIFLTIFPVAAFIAVGLLVWCLCRPPALYRVTILPTRGGLNTFAEKLNDHGQVMGVVYEDGHPRPFLWDHIHGIQGLGLAGECPMGLMVNNAQEVGGTTPTDPNSAKSKRAFLWESAQGRTMLGTLGGKMSLAIAMNNRGQIVGISDTADGCPHAFLWDRETGMQELTAPDGSRCQPVSINDAGQILVMSLKPTVVSPHPWFLLDPNGAEPLHPIPADTQPLSINASSCVAAIEKPGSPTSYLLLRDEHAIWKRVFHMHDQLLPARPLNDRNQIAYTEHVYSRWESLRNRLPRWLVRPRQPSYRATESYLWDPAHGRIPLNRYLRGITHFHVVDLNNNGCIVGTGQTKDGTSCSVLLEPIPERWGE